MALNIGSVLGLIGGSPIQKAGKVVIEKLKAAKTLEAGGMKGLLGNVLQNGPGEILKNPMSAINGQMGSTLTSALGALSGKSGMDGLINSISGSGGLQSAMSSLQSVTGSLSGLTSPGAGQFGLSDLIGHSGIISNVGSSLPNVMSMANASGPLNMESSISAMNTAIPGMISRVVAGTMTPEAATNTINQYTNTINNTITASNTAISTGQNKSGDLCNVITAVCAATGAPMDPELTVVMKKIVKTEVVIT
jgi:hypothetical protein